VPTKIYLAVLAALLFLLGPSVRAQYTADFQTNIISGVSSNWIGSDYVVGSNTASDALQILNGGVLSNGFGVVGYETNASNNSALVSGTGSVWSNRNLLIVGYHGLANSLIISNGGRVIVNDTSMVGFNLSNRVVVTGNGSLWYNGGSLSIGSSSSGNSLVISHGGQVKCGAVASFYYGIIGRDSGSSNNTVLVTDPNSIWTNSNGLYVGYQGSGNGLIVSNGGVVVGTWGIVGLWGGSSNYVLVTGVGSLWNGGGTNSIGTSGFGNSLIISNGGEVIAGGDDFTGCGTLGGSNNSARVVDGGVWRCRSSLFIGGAAPFAPPGWNNTLTIAGGTVFATNLIVVCGNSIQVDSGAVFITNASATAGLNVRGTFTINGGTLVTDKLVVTNACGRFIHTGGNLLLGTVVLNPNLSAVGDGIPNSWKQQNGLDPFDPNLGSQDPDGDGLSNLQEYFAGTSPTNAASALRIIGVVPEGNNLRVTWATAAGKTNALERSATVGTNFAGIFTVINTTGTVTNYLDVGAVTNTPAGFYRVRLVP